MDFIKTLTTEIGGIIELVHAEFLSTKSGIETKVTVGIAAKGTVLLKTTTGKN